MVLNVDDIRTAVLFARKYNLHVTIKSSGFDFLGRSSAHSSFSINLMMMKGMTVNPNSTARSRHGEITVETGVTWREINMELDKHQRVTAGPGAHAVTSGGYTMGGGHGPLSPSLGLGVDNVLEFQIVLADGRISTCTENRTIHHHPDGTEETENNGDLFWAIKGGGGGTFGVIVYYVYRLHKAPDSLVRIIISMPYYLNTTDKNIAREFFEQYNSWVKRAPPTWGGYVHFNNYPMQGVANGVTWSHTGTISAVLIKLGPWDESTASELQEFYDLKDKILPGIVSLFYVSNMSSYWDVFKDFSDSFDPRAKRSYTMGSLFPNNSHNNNLTEFLADEYLNDDEIPLACAYTRLGGKVKEFGEGSSSLHPGWRSAQTVVSCYVGIAEDTDSMKTYRDQARLKSKAAEFAARLRQFGSGEYLNEADADNPTWRHDYWGSHYPKLFWTKFHYDRDNLFSCHHCVGSDYLSFAIATDKSSTSGTSLITVFIATFTSLLLIKWEYIMY